MEWKWCILTEFLQRKQRILTDKLTTADNIHLEIKSLYSCERKVVIQNTSLRLHWSDPCLLKLSYSAVRHLNLVNITRNCLLNNSRGICAEWSLIVKWSSTKSDTTNIIANSIQSNTNNHPNISKNDHDCK